MDDLRTAQDTIQELIDDAREKRVAHKVAADRAQERLYAWHRLQDLMSELARQDVQIAVDRSCSKLMLTISLVDDQSLQRDVAAQPDIPLDAAAVAGPPPAKPVDEVPAPPEDAHPPAGAEVEAKADPAPVKKGGKFWTPQRNAQLIRLKEAGKTDRQIAEIVGTPVGAVSVHASKLSKQGAWASAQVDQPPAAGGHGSADTSPSPPVIEVAGAKAGSPAADDPGALTPSERSVLQRIEGCETQFTPAQDLGLVEGLARGDKIAALVDRVGLTADDLKQRFAALCPTGAIEEQAQVLRVLRHRLGLALSASP